MKTAIDRWENEGGAPVMLAEEIDAPERAVGGWEEKQRKKSASNAGRALGADTRASVTRLAELLAMEQLLFQNLRNYLSIVRGIDVPELHGIFEWHCELGSRRIEEIAAYLRALGYQALVESSERPPLADLDGHRESHPDTRVLIANALKDHAAILLRVGEKLSEKRHRADSLCYRTLSGRNLREAKKTLLEEMAHS